MRSGYRITQTQRAQIRALYLGGLAIRLVAERAGVCRKVVSVVLRDIKRPKSGWKEDACASTSSGWTSVDEQLARRRILDGARTGDLAARRLLYAMGLVRWERQGAVIMGAAR